MSIVMVKVGASKGGLPQSMKMEKAKRKADSQGTGLITAGGALFSAFIGDEMGPDGKFRPKQNKLNAWVEAQSTWINGLRSSGESRTQTPGWRYMDYDTAEGVINEFYGNLSSLDPWREDFLRNYPHLNQLLKDAYQPTDDYEAVVRRIDRWRPNQERMIPTLSVFKVGQEFGLVDKSAINDAVKNAIAKTDTDTKLEIVEGFEEELITYFEGVAKIERSRSQADKAQAFLNRIGSMIKTYSTSPDQVERLVNIEKSLKKLPSEQDGFQDFDKVKEVATDALAIFERQAPEDPFKDAHFTPEDEFELDGPLPYHEVEPVAIYHPENEAAEQPATPARYGWGSDDNEVQF